jgi:hypothetical protein
MMKIKFNELEIELNKVNIFIKEENELFILLHQIQNLDAVELYERFIELLGKRIKYNNRAGEILQISNDGKNIKFDIQVQDNEKNDFNFALYLHSSGSIKKIIPLVLLISHIQFRQVLHFLIPK